MDKRKKIWLVCGLGLLWIGVALWQWETFSEPVRAPLTNVSGVASVGKPVKEKASGLRVNLELLASARAQREATFTAPRNVFAVPRQDGTLTVGQAGGVVAEAVLDPALEAGLAQPGEAVSYRYLGFMRMGEGRKRANDIAILSKNEEVVVVKVGDHVEDRLVLKKITSDSVTIMDTAAHREHTVPLSEEPQVQP